METKVAVVGAGKAKPLRPTDSGVFRAVHGLHTAALGSQCPANDQGDSAPGQIRSDRRAALSRGLAALLGNSLRVDEVSDTDAAAACDRQRQHVLDMRSPGGRVITLADGVLIARVSPTWRAALVDLIGGTE